MKRFYLQAKFAAFRPFVSGSFRPTAGFITPSAAYGLLLNIAGIDMRYDDGKSVMTLIRQDLPMMKIALGMAELPVRQCLLHQLHNYPIGATGQDHAANTKGGKYNIIPVKREMLSNIKAYIFIDGNSQIEEWIADGLNGNRHRGYGLPFIGDNNFLLDRFELITDMEPVWWFEKIENDSNGIREYITRLTTSIDRADLSRTRSSLFAPSISRKKEPSVAAWVQMP
jgi:CRISPR-associated protein Cas5t